MWFILGRFDGLGRRVRGFVGVGAMVLVGLLVRVGRRVGGLVGAMVMVGLLVRVGRRILGLAVGLPER